MLPPEIEEFAKLLMRHVRDEAIASCNLTRNPECNSLDAKRWREQIDLADVDELLDQVIPDCVDAALFYLLHSIDEGLLKLSYGASSGKLINLVEAGNSELAGWCSMGGEDDWRARFSKESFNDDFTDLNLNDLDSGEE